MRASDGDAVLAEAARTVALGELTSAVVHKIGNPLTGIAGLVELELEVAALDDASRARLALVRESALEIQTVLTAVQRFSRGTHRGEPIALTAAVEQAIAVATGVGLLERERVRQSHVSGGGGGGMHPNLLVDLLIVLLAFVSRNAGDGVIGVEVQDGPPPATASLGLVGGTIEDGRGYELVSRLAQACGFRLDRGAGRIILTERTV